MKKIVFPKYGSPDVLQLVEVDPPLPKEHQVLVKVYAASANPIDGIACGVSPSLRVWGRVSTNPKIRSLGGYRWAGGGGWKKCHRISTG